MGQLARLPEARIVGLAGFVAALGTLVTVCFEEIQAALGENDGSVVRAERTPANQPLVLQMPNATTPIAGLVTQVVEVALGYNPKRADGPEHAALGSVDLVDAVALSDRPTLASPWKVDIRRKYVARIAVFVAIEITTASATAETAIPQLAAVAVVASRIVPVPHGQSVCEPDFGLRVCARRSAAFRRLCTAEIGQATQRLALSVVVRSRSFLSPVSFRRGIVAIPDPAAAAIDVIHHAAAAVTAVLVAMSG